MNGFDQPHERILIWTDAGQWQYGEEIVRCRDCMHFKKADSGSFCAKSITTLTDPDGFCSWGERRGA